MLVNITPGEYGLYLSKDKKDNSLLYVKLHKALYCIMEQSQFNVLPESKERL